MVCAAWLVLLSVCAAEIPGTMASGADTDATANAVLHAARDNLEKVGLAMDTVRSIAKKERVRTHRRHGIVEGFL